MNGISVFAGVCLFFSATFVGLWIRKRYKGKADFYEEYYRYLLYVSERISYEKMPIGEIIATFPKGEKTDFYDFLTGKEVKPPISEGELTEIGKYLSEIGTTDADTQIASLNVKCAELKRYTEVQCVKYRKDGALYFKLSVLIGIVAFIIIV